MRAGILARIVCGCRTATSALLRFRSAFPVVLTLLPDAGTLCQAVPTENSRSRAALPIAPIQAQRPRLATTPMESCGPDDCFHDYVLLEYEPVASAVDKLRSLNVLVESFALGGVEKEGVALMNAVRRGLGPFRTVWGIKWHHARRALGWELYFYDFKREHADISIPNLTRILAPHVEVEGREPRPLPWHMFSVEIDGPKLRREAASALDIYVDMRSYKCSGDGAVFENVYTFHHARSEIDDILHRLRACVHFDPERDRLERLMPPHLFNCRKICVANKRRADALYFSRVTTRALMRFLEDQGWPEELSAFVDGREKELNHLLWDVGIDFRATDGGATPVKTGIYGSF